MPATCPEQQLAETLCHGFFSWHLQHDHAALTRLGDGKLEIDLLQEACRHKKQHIPALMIVGLLARQCRSFVDGSEIGADEVKKVWLSVDLEFDEHDEQRDRSVWWFGEVSGFVGCKVDIEVIVRTAAGTYRAKQSRLLEWPKRVATR